MSGIDKFTETESTSRLLVTKPEGIEELGMTTYSDCFLFGVLKCLELDSGDDGISFGLY